MTKSKVSNHVPIRVAIIEDNDNLREHFSAIVHDAPQLHLVWTAGNLERAKAQVAAYLVDVALVDLGLPDGHGRELIEAFAARGGTKTLVVTVFDDRASVRRAIEAGAHGYIVKDSDPVAIVDSIEAIFAGGAPISASAAIHLLGLIRSPAKAKKSDLKSAGDVPVLTLREIELLELFARGLSYRETADCLGLSKHTVADYVKSIYRKLGVSSRSEAVFEAVHFKIIEL